MSTIKEILARNIEENIAPVIYFHQLDPQVAAQEVREYVFTTRPKTQVHQVGGIHEQMTNLVKEIANAIEKGHKLPASWISGYFGSGKSSFAKLLGLALDGLVLPDGSPMVQALLDRDDTGLGQELKTAFDRLRGLVDSRAVIFDIGTSAKNNESIPHTIYRQVLEKLGYSSYDGVANYEIALEDEGKYPQFLDLYRTQYAKDWTEGKNSGLAVNRFRTIYSQLYPGEPELLEASTFNLHTMNIKKMAETLVRVMDRRAPGKTFFVVVDEVSQYIARDHNKMLDLQSFVSEIGGRARPGHSRLWLLVTGQEKLEDEGQESVLFKLKDRFPVELRVHLDRANVREVVDRRLLKKKAGNALEAYLTPAHVDSLKLYGFETRDLTREQLVQTYPLLPSHIPLFMDITQSIRNTSTRTQSDAGGVRSVLNNIWDLFNQDPVKLKDRPLGTLMTLDMLYDVIGSSVDSDVQMSLNKVFEKYPKGSWEVKTAKAIALLEMNGEQRPVTPELLASLLYPELGAGSCKAGVEEALKVLKTDNWVQFHEKSGWSIQNNAAQDWNRQKSEIAVPASEVEEYLTEVQTSLASEAAAPKLEGVSFPLTAWWGQEKKLSTGRSDLTQVGVCFHWITNASRRAAQDDWIAQSRQDAKRIHWVSGDTSHCESLVRQFQKSRKMVKKFDVQPNLSPVLTGLLHREMGERDRLRDEVKKALRETWMGGQVYFDGTAAPPRPGNFEAVVRAEAEDRLPQIYHRFSQGNVRITEGDFEQLLKRDTAGLPLCFFEQPGGLGIVYNDGGRIHFRCTGPVPQAVMNLLQERTYISGDQVLERLAGAPYGYSLLVLKSAVVGLLREEKIRILNETRNVISTIGDPGALNLFRNNREFQKSEIEMRQGDGLGPRDKNAIRQFFEQTLGVTGVEGGTDELADLADKHFPSLKSRVRNLETKLLSLGLKVPGGLGELDEALGEVQGTPQHESKLTRLKAKLEVLRRGYAQVQEAEEALTPETVQELRALGYGVNELVRQLAEIGEDGSVREEASQIRDQLAQAEAWRGWADAKPALQKLTQYYREVRLDLIARQRKVLGEGLDSLKLRSGFSDLEPDQQYQAKSQLEKAVTEGDPDAVAPSLVVLEQGPRRVTEALARAHKLVDDFLSELARQREEAGGGVPLYGRVSVVRLGLSNRVIKSEAELESLLDKVRQQCLKELQSGQQVRLEE